MGNPKKWEVMCAERMKARASGVFDTLSPDTDRVECLMRDAHTDSRGVRESIRHIVTHSFE